MKKETRNLFLGFVLGVVGGLISDWLFELRTEVLPWIAENLGVFCLFLAIAVVIGYLITK